MSTARHTNILIGILSLSTIALSILFAVTRQDLQTAETQYADCVKGRRAAQASSRQEFVDTKAALKAAQYLSAHDTVQDYASRSEPEIRLCVPSYGDSKVLRVQRCTPGKSEVVFPINYPGSDHHPELGGPTVDHRSLNTP